MSDQSKENRNLSEISHLFLSSIRDKASNGAAPPQRTPPGKPKISIDLTPEEFAQVFEKEAAEPESADRGKAHVPQVVAIIGAHLNGKQFDRAKEYAAHLASSGMRVGMIEVDASEFRVICFDPDSGQQTVAVEAECSFDPRRMNEVLDEMSWDVQRWLLVLPSPRVPEARALLRDCSRWLLLSTCDHDGVISCYRTLKGLTDLWPAGPENDRPALSLALLDAPDAEQADKVSGKLASVCQQFLNWPLEVEPSVRPSQRGSEHLVMCCRPTRDKGQLGTAPQWQIVVDLIARSKQAPAEAPATPTEDETTLARESSEAPKRFVADFVIPTPPADSKPVMRVVPMQTSETASAPRTDANDVIDLPSNESGEPEIVLAILRHCSSELVECPITPPMCPNAKLAVGRDRRVVMLAVAQHGLADLNTIGQAYQWLQQNQALIGMAVPQLAIDMQQSPHLSLLINQADSAAHTLQPMLQGDHVTVKTYRKLRWGGKTGLLLEAA
jgi:hypothetical protein